jgi:hypothetical protein
MKKILIISLMLAVMLATVPAFAGQIWNISGSSRVAVNSASFGNSGSGSTAYNTSFAGVAFDGKTVTTLATTTGQTSGYGFNFASQSGNGNAFGMKWGN